MHRMRMPFDRQMRACKPGRPSRTQGAGSALLAWLKPADRKLTHDATRLQRSARVITHPLQGATANPTVAVRFNHSRLFPAGLMAMGRSTFSYGLGQGGGPNQMNGGLN